MVTNYLAKRNHKKQYEIKAGSKIFDVINIILLIVLAFIMIYPLWYIIILSFNEGVDAYNGGLYLIPRQFTFDNYVTAFQNRYLLTSFLISIARTVLGTLVSVICICMLGYALSDERLPGRKFFTKFFFFTTLFGAGAIPMLLLISDLNLLDNFLVYIVPAVYGFTNVLIMRIAFSGIPKEVKENARLDGASEIAIFFKICLPLVGSSIATIALFTAVFHWSDWYAGKYYISSELLRPAATILQDMITSSAGASSYLTPSTTTTATTLQAAFVVIIAVPILFVYPFAQKYFVKGAIVGSIKE